MSGRFAAPPQVFAFWEPPGEMSAYLRLCLLTWEARLPEYPIVLLDSRSALDHIESGTYDPAALATLSLPMLKDALMVAILERNGGVFMDVDTLAFRSLEPLLEPLDRSEVVTLGMHMAFLAAKPGARLLSVWRKDIQQKLNRLVVSGPPAGGLKWDHLGNSGLRVAIDEVAAAIPGGQPFPARAMRIAGGLAGSLQGRSRIQRFERVLGRIEGGLTRRSLERVARGPASARLTTLDPRRTGFIAEAVHFGSRRLSSRRKYERFWFEDDVDDAAVTRLDPVIVGLHNSWTPPWYSALTEAEVLAGHSLLSRTLRRLVHG